MSQIINEFKRPKKAIVKQYQEVAKCYSASCVFADVQRRRGVMYSSIKPISNGTLVGSALTVKL
jgi:regulator of RNase E activity RraA